MIVEHTENEKNFLKRSIINADLVVADVVFRKFFYLGREVFGTPFQTCYTGADLVRLMVQTLEYS